MPKFRVYNVTEDRFAVDGKEFDTLEEASAKVQEYAKCQKNWADPSTYRIIEWHEPIEPPKIEGFVIAFVTESSGKTWLPNSEIYATRQQAQAVIDTWYWNHESNKLTAKIVDLSTAN